MATLEIRDLHVTVATEDGPKEILKGVTLTIKDGETHAIMGPNGSGKSTLAYSIAGHPKYTVTSGSVTLDGRRVPAHAVLEREHDRHGHGRQHRQADQRHDRARPQADPAGRDQHDRPDHLAVAQVDQLVGLLLPRPRPARAGDPGGAHPGRHRLVQVRDRSAEDHVDGDQDEDDERRDQQRR